VTRFAPTLATVFVAAALAPAQTPATPEPVIKIDSPRLRAALYELRLARQSLSESKDVWPLGYRDRALESTHDAIDTVQILLAVKEKDPLADVGRTDDYYKKYADHPRLRAAIDDLRDARDELKGNKEVVGPKREEAIDHIDMAVGDILTLIRYKPNR
jgi:hypothetical protein